MDAALVSRIASVRSTVERLNQQLDYESQTIVRLGGRIKQLEDEKTQLVKAVGLIDRCIQVISSNGIGKIESIVSDGLRRVFDDPTLTLVVEKKSLARGNAYSLLVQKDGGEPYDPMKSYGGGVVNVIALLLRLILIKRFKLAKLMILDEQFSNVSSEYLPTVSDLLKTLTDKHGYTILAVTHQPILADAADSIYQVLCGTCGSGVKCKCPKKGGKPPTLHKVEGLELETLKSLLYERSAAEEDQTQVA
jgi:DNA repair exonuclease SbcCD ATPase subunit